MTEDTTAAPPADTSAESHTGPAAEHAEAAPAPSAVEPVATPPEAQDEPEPDPAESEPAPADAGADETLVDAPAAEPPPPDNPKKWYVVKVQSGREESIKAAIERKIKIEGLEEFFGQILIPVEEFVEKKSVRAKVKNKKTGEVETVTQEKNVVKKRKKFHGYVFAEVEFNDRILYVFRETSGVGDFVGSGGPLKPPAPMAELEVRKMLGTATHGEGKPKQVVKLDYEKGDRVRVKDGAFSGSEAEVKLITMPKDPADTPKVTVVVTIWGRPVEMEMDYWHVEKL